MEKNESLFYNDAIRYVKYKNEIWRHYVYGSNL